MNYVYTFIAFLFLGLIVNIAMFVYQNFWNILIFLGFSGAIYFVCNYFAEQNKYAEEEKRLEEERIAKEKLEAEAAAEIEKIKAAKAKAIAKAEAKARREALRAAKEMEETLRKMKEAEEEAILQAERAARAAAEAAAKKRKAELDKESEPTNPEPEIIKPENKNKPSILDINLKELIERIMDAKNFYEIYSGLKESGEDNLDKKRLSKRLISKIHPDKNSGQGVSVDRLNEVAGKLNVLSENL